MNGATNMMTNGTKVISAKISPIAAPPDKPRAPITIMTAIIITPIIRLSAKEFTSLKAGTNPCRYVPIVIVKIATTGVHANQ